MVVAERARTGAHRWENDWCPKCKLRMTFWFVSETRTRCAMCATEKDKTRGLDLGPREEEAPAPEAEARAAETPAAEAPSAEAPAADAPAPEADAAFVPVPVTAPPPPEEKPPQEPVWILSWCSECRYNASFVHVKRESFQCMSCGMSKLLPGVEPPNRD
jgi:hypothetical protein